MDKQIHSPKFLKRRKFLLVLPLLALPFITFLYWSLGGGKTSDANAQITTQKGINMVLPDAKLDDDKPLDKMSYYDKAASDSAKRKEQMKNDPYYQNYDVITNRLQPRVDTSLPKKNNNLNLPSYPGYVYSDPNEAKVYTKLDQLNAALNKTSSLPENIPDNNNTSLSQRDKRSLNTADVDRLEEMMQSMNQKDDEDPEMQQLNGVLGKILDIQHPERLQEKIRQTSEESKGQVFTVASNAEPNIVTSLDTIKRFATASNRFYSNEDDISGNNAANAIEAVVHETQTLLEGSTVKLRLINDVYINGALIPKNNFLFGTASLNGERLNIKISSIRYLNSLYPVDLSVFDMDGLGGIFIPGAISRDVAKQSSDRALQNIGLNTLDPSLKVQAAAAGIEAAKGLLSKKVKLIRVTVRAGYQVLLRDEKQKQNN